jgi:hypothetical protein
MEEYTNSPEMDDGSDMFIDAEPTSEAETDVEQPEQEKADPVQPEQKEAPAEKGPTTLKIKYNGEERDITLEEAVTLAQKGMNYDKVAGERDSLKNSKEKQILEKFAKASGVKVDDYIKYLEDNLHNSAVQAESDKIKAEYPDAPEKFIKELAEKRIGERKAAQEREETTQKQLEADAAKKKEMEPWLAFAARYPDRTELTPEEVKLVQAGRTPIEARLEYEKAQREKEVAELKLKLETQDKNKKNKEKAVGPVSSTAGDSPVDDPFLRGFNG